MFIMSRVCAEFRDRKGNPIFTINEKNMLNFIEAPDAIQEDPLFQLLLADRAIEANVTPAQRRALEQDPMAGMDASGKMVTDVKEEENQANAGKAKSNSGKSSSGTKAKSTTVKAAADEAPEGAVVASEPSEKAEVKE